MITKMKKLTFLVYHKEYEEFLKRIRDLGVLHIQTAQEGSSDTSVLQERIQLADRIKRMIESFANIEPSAQEGDAAKGPQALEHIEQLQAEKQAQEGLVQGCRKEEEALEVWGNFDPKNISRLKENGYEVRFFTCPARNFNPEWEEQFCATLINKEGDRLYFITVTPAGQQPDLDAEAVTLPPRSLQEATQQKEVHEHAAEAIQKQIDHCAHKHLKDLQAWLQQLHSSVAFDQVVLGTCLLYTSPSPRD